MNKNQRYILILSICGAVIAVTAAAILIVSAVKRNRTAQNNTGGDISIADEGELEQYEDTGAPVEVSEDEEEPVSEISQEDADMLINEKLEGKNCTPVYNEVMNVEGENYYTYTVLDETETEMAQMLAVNAVSGDVYVYDLDNNTVFDFSTFELYNNESDAAVLWEGSFKSGSYTAAFEPADTNSVEFTLKNNDKELAGVAMTNGNTAVFEDGGVSLEFVLNGNSLEIKDQGESSGFAGTLSR